NKVRHDHRVLNHGHGTSGVPEWTAASARTREDHRNRPIERDRYRSELDPESDMITVPTEQRERGFTLVETIAVVVILGLIVVPLCTTMTQMLTLVPQSGRRTLSATDISQLGQVFSDDV